MWTRYIYILFLLWSTHTQIWISVSECQMSRVVEWRGIRFRVGYLLRRLNKMQMVFTYWTNKGNLCSDDGGKKYCNRDVGVGNIHQLCAPQFLSRRFSRLPTFVEPLAADRKSWLMFFPPCDRITNDPEITSEGRRLLSVRPTRHNALSDPLRGRLA